MSKKLETESTLYNPQQDESLLGITQADTSKLHNPQQDESLLGITQADTSKLHNPQQDESLLGITQADTSKLHNPQQDESLLGITQADTSKLHNPQQDDLLYGTIPMDTSSDRYISENDDTQEQSESGQLLQGGQCLGRPKIPKLDFSKIKKHEEGQKNLSMACELEYDDGSLSSEDDDGNLSSEEDDKAIVSGPKEKVTDEKDPRPNPERPECVPKLNLSFERDGP